MYYIHNLKNLISLTTITLFPRYNVESWLKILSDARPKFHPQHMIMIEIAKWLVPILCRGPGIDIIYTSLVFQNKIIIQE